MVYSPSSFRLNLFITAAMPSADEQFGGVRRAGHRLGDDRPFFGCEPRQHVIRQVAPGIASPDADPQPSRTPRVPSCPMIDFSPLCPPADPDGRARSRPSSRCTSSTTTSTSAGSILKNRSSSPTGWPLRFMNVSGLTSSAPRRSPPRHERVGRPALPLQPVPLRQSDRRRRSRRCDACRRTSGPGFPRPTMSFMSHCSRGRAPLARAGTPSLRPCRSCPS